jgi:hypothetical protein
MIHCNSLVIIPNGSIADMMNVIVSARVLCEYHKIHLLVIWEHDDYTYQDFFYDPLRIVHKNFLSGKNYVYNPEIDPSTLLKHVQFTQDSETYLVLETRQEIVDTSIPFRQYITQRHIIYTTLIREDVSGVVVGQMGLYDIPDHFVPEFCDEIQQKDSNTTKMHDVSFGIENNEYTDYLKLLVCSKAKVLVCSGQVTDRLAVYVSNIFMIPLLCLETESFRDIPTVTAKSSSYPKPYEYICNPIPLHMITDNVTL